MAVRIDRNLNGHFVPNSFGVFLFAGELPPAHLHAGFGRLTAISPGGRFGPKDGAVITDEIALNPSYCRARTTEQSPSMLVHNMGPPVAASFRQAVALQLPPTRDAPAKVVRAAMMKALC